MANCIKISLLCCTLFGLLCCGKQEIPAVCSQNENLSSIPFEPHYTAFDLPIHIENNLNLPTPVLQEATAYWENIAGRSLFNLITPGTFNIDFVLNPDLDTLGAAGPVGSLNGGCTIYLSELHSDNVSLLEFILRHELGHCLGFWHDNGGACNCVMGGSNSQDLEKHKCDLEQLFEYVN